MSVSRYPVTEQDAYLYPTLRDVPVDNIGTIAELLLEASSGIITLLQARERALNPDIGVELIVGKTVVGISSNEVVLPIIENEIKEIIKFIEGKENTWA